MTTSQTDARSSIMELIDPGELTRLAQDMIRIPSVCGDEEKVALFLAKKFAEWGYDVTMDEVTPRRPNVYATLRGKSGGPTLMYNGHIDVVPPGDGWDDEPYSGTIKGGRLYGRGAADMKGPLASMIIAANALKMVRAELKGNLVITAVVDEEENQKGTQQIVDRKMKADFAIIGEATGLEVCIAHKGDVTCEITTTGKAAHSSVLHEGVNAIYKMSKIIDAIERFSLELEAKKTHPLLGCATISIGTIEGGTVSSAVPGFCKIKVDRRTLPDETAQTGKKELEDLIAELASEDSCLVGDVKILIDALPMKISEDQPVVVALRKAITEITGHDPRIMSAPYTTDAGILVNKGRIPTVVFGPGDIGQFHRPNESISIDDMTAAAKIYALTALQLLS